MPVSIPFLKKAVIEKAIADLSFRSSSDYQIRILFLHSALEDAIIFVSLQSNSIKIYILTDKNERHEVEPIIEETGCAVAEDVRADFGLDCAGDFGHLPEGYHCKSNRSIP